jgi:hypothetical protein
MTESEWLACTDPKDMLAFLHDGKATDRKWWLYACACCRRAWHLLRDARGRRAVDVAESYAEGQAGAGDKEHPRLHYGWQTTKEYRSRFGYLDYMCRGPGEPYARRAGPPARLPEGLEERCGFVLYPYVSRTSAEAVTWGAHAEALERLRGGAAHPAREEVLELAASRRHCRPPGRRWATRNGNGC